MRQNFSSQPPFTNMDDTITGICTGATINSLNLYANTCLKGYVLTVTKVHHGLTGDLQHGKIQLETEYPCGDEVVGGVAVIGFEVEGTNNVRSGCTKICWIIRS